MTATDYLESKILDHVLGTVPYTPPTSLYLCLHTDDPSESGNLNPVIGGSYAPQPIAFATDNYVNKLTNPGFAGTVGAGIASGWTVPVHPTAWTPTIEPGTFQRVSTTFLTTQGAVRIQQRVTGVSSIIGQVVQFTCSTRNPSSLSGNNMTLAAIAYNASNTLLANFATGYNPTSGWTNHILEFTLPTTGGGTSYIDLIIEHSGSQTSGTDIVDVDDAYFGIVGSNQRASIGVVVFPSMPSTTVTHFAVRENSATGPAMFSGPLSFARGVTAGDPLIFGPGQIVVRAD